MITVYLDHNVIDGFDKGKTTYLEPLLANKGVLLIISLASVDEIFRGGDEARSRSNIESLKKLGVRYIHSGPDESHLSISELDYENMHQEWLKMQSSIGPFNDAHFSFIRTIYRGNAPEALQNMGQVVNDRFAWIKSNFDKFPNFQSQWNKDLSNPREYSELCVQLIQLKTLLPFTAREINNIAEESVFWNCVDKLKSNIDANLQNIGGSIQDQIESAKTVEDQFVIVFFWLNLFEYYPDDLTRIDRVRSNFSDANHSTYAIACDAMLTLDKKFAKRAAATMRALKLKTEVSTDAIELFQRISS